MATARRVRAPLDTNEVSVQSTVRGEAIVDDPVGIEESKQADVAEQDERLANDLAPFTRKELSKHGHLRAIECLDSLPGTARRRLFLPAPVVSRRLSEGVR